MKKLGRNLFLGVLGFALISGVQTAFAVSGSWGGRPANPRPDNPRTDSIFIHTVEAGETATDAIRVVNNTTETKTLQVYATDSLIATEGAFSCEQATDTKDLVGNWITLEKNETTLASGASEIVPFTIATPFNAPVGENNGCIVIQEKQPEEQSVDLGGGTGVVITTRNAIRVAVTVDGILRKDLKIVGLKVEKNDRGGHILHPEIRNTGNVSLDTAVSVVTRYWTGWQFMRHGGEYPILANQTSEWNFDLPRSFWGGLMFARVYAAYDPATDAELGQTNDRDLKLVKGPIRFFWQWPTMWGWLANILLLLVLAALGLLIWLKFRQRKWMREDWIQYKVKPGENIVELGKKFDTNWRLIAARNGLPAPYLLLGGEVLFVPGKDMARPARKSTLPTKVAVRKTTTLVAEKGDTLKDIAAFAGITISELAKLNNITKARSYKVKAGQEFIVPEE